MPPFEPPKQAGSESGGLFVEPGLQVGIVALRTPGFQPLICFGRWMSRG